MNEHYARKIIAALKDDLENNDKSGLFDDITRAERLFGEEIPEILDCTEEVKNFGDTVFRNAQIIKDLLERKLEEQDTLSFDLEKLEINDAAFFKLVEQSFRLYKEAKIDMATEKIWDAFERIKTYYQKFDKKESADKLLDAMSKNNAGFRSVLQDEFSALTKVGNEFRIRHHETNKKEICCDEHYDYLFTRCLSVLKLAATVLNEVMADEI